MSEQFCCFKKELCACQGERTDSSIATYCYNLCWLQKRLDGFSETGQPSYDDVLGYMTENSIAMRRQQSSYVAMKVLLNARNLQDESDKYARPLIEVKNKLQNEYDKQERSERQQKNWVDYKDLNGCAKKLRAETYELDKNTLWTKDEYARAQLGFILTFHLKYPLRRILCTVLYKPADKLAGNVLDDKTRKITIRNHKMQRKYKDPFVFQLDRNMWRLAQLLRKQHKLRGVEKDAPLLVSRYWRPMSRNSYCNWLKREMGKLEPCKGKSVGCLAIRNSVITHKRRNDSSMLDRKQFAYNCMHRPETNEMYRVN